MRKLFAALLFLLLPAFAWGDAYFNSTEPGCDGSNADYLFCDDFEDGDWFTWNCDNNPTNKETDSDGWCGVLSSNYTATSTITNASPAVVTYQDALGGDFWLEDDPVRTETGGTLPSPLAGQTRYYIVNLNTSNNTTELSSTIQGASINTTTDGSGTHTLEAERPFPVGAVQCSGAGFGSDCAAHGGDHTGGIGGVNMADHNLYDGSTQAELYLRYYYRAESDFSYGAQKMITLNTTAAGGGGITFGGIGSPFDGSGGEPLGCPVEDCNNLSYNNPQCSGSCPGGVYLNNNISSITFDSGKGNWYFIEIRVKSNSGAGVQDGIFELWMDDCGAAADQCTGTPTKRASYTNVRWTSDASPVQSIWFENWANPASTGIEWYDQIVVSKTGPIGFFEAAAAPGSVFIGIQQ